MQKTISYHFRNYSLAVVLLSIVSIFAINGISFSSTEEADNRYRAVRAMGMGNVFSAVADDGDAFYYNPAGLSDIRKVRVDIQPLRLIPTRDLYEESKDMGDLIDDMDKLSKSSDPLEDPALKNERIRIADKLERMANENLGLDIAAPVRIIIPFHIGNYGAALGFNAGVWSDSKIQIKKRGLNWSDPVKNIMDDEVFYKIMAEAHYGLASAIKFPVPTTPIALSFGFYARNIHRNIMTDEDDMLKVEYILNPKGPDGIKGTDDDFENRYFDPNDPLDMINKGKGYSLDAGVMASVSESLKLALTFQNLIGKIDYKEIDDYTMKKYIGTSASLNASKFIGISSISDIILTAGMDDINDKESYQLGLEAIWKLGFLSLSGRIGNNKGYLTMGAGLQLFFLDIDYAFFGDEATDWHAISLNLAF